MYIMHVCLLVAFVCWLDSYCCLVNMLTKILIQEIFNLLSSFFHCVPSSVGVAWYSIGDTSNTQWGDQPSGFAWDFERFPNTDFQGSN